MRRNAAPDGFETPIPGPSPRSPRGKGPTSPCDGVRLVGGMGVENWSGASSVFALLVSKLQDGICTHH